MRVFIFWGFCVLVSCSFEGLRADYPFRQEPVSYYDAGDSLSQDSQEYLLRLMKQRLSAIEKRFSEVVAFEVAVDEAKKASESSMRIRARHFALGGAAVGASMTFLLGTYFMPSLRLGPNASILLSSIAASLGGVFGMSAGLIWAQRNQVPTPVKYRVILDERGEEILKAAEDLSAQIRGMSVPRVFWSMRRLQDFTRRMSAFAALEHILLREVNQLTDEMKSALQDLRMSHFISVDVETDLAEAEFELVRAKIIRRFRELEYHTLRLIAQDFEEEVKIPFSGIDYSKMTVPQCLAILRFLIRDDSLPVSEETDMQKTLR